MIDMPQIVDVIANPRGADFLTRDSANVARWFTARGLTGVTPAQRVALLALGAAEHQPASDALRTADEPSIGAARPRLGAQ